MSNTPYLNTLSKESTLYTQARAPSSWSLPSHASIFTGVHAHDHGIHSTKDSLPAGHTIFEELSDDGYATGVFSENPFISTEQNGLCRFDHVTGPAMMRFSEGIDVRDFTIHEGVEQYRRYFEACLEHEHTLKSLWNGFETKITYDFPWIPTGGPNHPPGTYYSQKFLDWSAEQDSPWAACVNLMDAHYPFQPTEFSYSTPEALSFQSDIDSIAWDFFSGDQPWWVLDILRSLYNDTIRDADLAVAMIVEGLRTRGVLDDTLVVITSDHGEVFGTYSEVYPECRMVGHNMWTHEKLLHVPLVVRTPGQTTAGVCNDLSSLTQFPDVVRAVRADSDASDGFAVEDYAFASVHWTDTHNMHETFRENIDLAPFMDRAEVAYVQTAEGIYKTVRRGEREVDLLVHSTAVTSAPDTTPLDLDAALSTTTSTIESTRASDEYDPDMLDRLEDLGYM